MRAALAALIGAIPLAAQTARLSELTLLETVKLEGTLHHVQGIDLDGQRLWVTSVDRASRKGYLHEFTLPGGKLARTVEVQEGTRFHPGGISVDATSVWVPVAEYRRDGSTIVQRRSKAGLAIEYRFEVPDHIGCIAVSPEALVGGNWDSRELSVWNHRGVLQRRVPNPTGNAFQDLKFAGGMLVGSGLLRDGGGAIDWLDFPALKPLRRILAGRTDRGETYTREGMAIRNGRLYLLPEDGPSRLFVFRLEP